MDGRVPQMTRVSPYSFHGYVYVIAGGYVVTPCARYFVLSAQHGWTEVPRDSRALRHAKHYALAQRYGQPSFTFDGQRHWRA